MISKEERESKKQRISNPAHILQVFKERGKILFNDCSVKNMLAESWTHTLDYERSVIVLDERKDKKSSHVIIFLTDAGKLAAIPCIIDEFHITFLSLKDVMKDESNPNWFIKKYNNFGVQKGLTKLGIVFRP